MSESIVEQVREKYAASGGQRPVERPRGRPRSPRLRLYAEELASIPAEANMGLSCGNPTATAHLKPGEVVVDLGCGGGLDVLLAAPRVGPEGKAIGIDMTPEMIERPARQRSQGGRCERRVPPAPPSTGCRCPMASPTASSATVSSTWRRTSGLFSARCFAC